MTRNVIAEYQKGELIQSHPEFDIYAAKPTLNYDLKFSLPHFKAGDEVGLPFDTAKYGILYHWFMFGSAASFALENYGDPIASYQKELERGHKTHWLITLPTTISNRAPEKIDKLACKWSEKVLFEGRCFTIEKTFNGNANLVPVRK